MKITKNVLINQEYFKSEMVSKRTNKITAEENSI